MRSTPLFALALLAGAPFGCATTRPPEPAAPPPAQASAAAPAAPAADSGVISRRELDQFLDQSPGVFLQHVDTSPRFSGKRFAGWRLNAFFPGDARFAGVDLRAGDVIERVNGSSLERPEQLMQLWWSLRSAHELVVKVDRDGRERTLRWAIGERLPGEGQGATIAPGPPTSGGVTSEARRR